MNTLPKSFKKLSDYEKAEVWSVIELMASHVVGGARAQKLSVVMLNLPEIERLCNILKGQEVDALKKIKE